MRQDEMEFLGMIRKDPYQIKDRPKTSNDAVDPRLIRMKEATHRKNVQEEHWNFFEKQKKEIESEIKDIEGEDIRQTMLQERREWI